MKTKDSMDEDFVRVALNKGDYVFDGDNVFVILQTPVIVKIRRGMKVVYRASWKPPFGGQVKTYEQLISNWIDR